MSDETTQGQRVLRIFSKAQKADFVARYLASGLTLRAFSEQNNICYMSLWRWVGRAKKKTDVDAAPTTFAEIKLSSGAPRSDWAVELTLPNGTVLRMTKDTPPGMVEQLLRLC